MGLGSLKHILKVEIIQTEQQKQNNADESGALQYACAVAVLKYVFLYFYLKEYNNRNRLLSVHNY